MLREQSTHMMCSCTVSARPSGGEADAETWTPCFSSPPREGRRPLPRPSRPHPSAQRRPRRHFAIATVGANPQAHIHVGVYDLNEDMEEDCSQDKRNRDATYGSLNHIASHRMAPLLMSFRTRSDHSSTSHHIASLQGTPCDDGDALGNLC